MKKIRTVLLASMLAAAFGCSDSDPESPPEMEQEPSTQWLQISAGSDTQACAIREDRTLWCWGRGSVGPFPTDEDRTAPEQIGSESDWEAVSTGPGHTCGIRDTDALFCWGANLRGQLGLGDSEVRSQPTQVEPSARWRTVSTGTNFTCGIQRDGSLWCWGETLNGKLGLGDGRGDVMEPEQVGDATNWRSVSTRGQGACGIRDDDSLWCWGAGGGETSEERVPTRVGDGWNRVSQGDGSICAIRNDRTLWCWGSGNHGRLGLGDTQDHPTPQQVGSEDTWTAVSTGGLRTFALRDDGSIWWAGQEYFGLNPSPTLTRVESQTTWRSLSAGDSFACAIDDRDALMCWGPNFHGELGVGDTGTIDEPERPVNTP